MMPILRKSQTLKTLSVLTVFFGLAGCMTPGPYDQPTGRPPVGQPQPVGPNIAGCWATDNGLVDRVEYIGPDSIYVTPVGRRGGASLYDNIGGNTYESRGAGEHTFTFYNNGTASYRSKNTSMNFSYIGSDC